MRISIYTTVMFCRLAKVLLFVFVTVLVIDQSLTAQQRQLEKIDSVLLLLAKEDLPPRKRIAAQLRLTSFYKMAHPDVDSLIEVSLRQAVEGEYTFYEARALKFRARYRLYLNDNPDLILADIRRIEEIARNFENELIPGWVSNLYAQYYLQIGEAEKAKVHLDSLEVQITRNKYKRAAIYHTVRGMYHQALQEYDLAIASYEKSLPDPNAGKSYVYNNLARLHLEIDDLDNAIYNVEQSLKYSVPQRNTIPQIASYILLGDIHLAKGDTTEAVSYYEQAEALREVPYYSKNYSALSKLVGIYAETKPRVLDSLLVDISSYQMTADYPALLVAKADMTIRDGRVSAGTRLYKEALTIADQRLDYPSAIKACDRLSELYTSGKQFDKATEFLTQKSKYESEVYDQTRMKSLARNLARFESEKEKALLEQAYVKDQQILKERLSRQRIAGLLGLLILLTALFSWYKLRKKNHLIEEQNEVISKALSEKDLLLREIHHRVKNNLQLVSSLLTLQGRSIDDEMAQQAIQAGQSRVRSMALIHQDLYNKENLTDIGVKEYVEKLTSELFSTYRVDDSQVKLQMDVDDMDLDVDTLVPLGLILNELITNCLKYAFADSEGGVLSVSLTLENDMLLLRVKDNGVGYDPSSLREDSFGSTLVNALVEQLEGELRIEHQGGTEVSVVMKHK